MSHWTASSEAFAYLTPRSRRTSTSRLLARKATDLGCQLVPIPAGEEALTCTADPGLLSPPNHKLINIITSVNVEDALSGPAGFVLRSIASNEADSGLGDGDLAGDMQGWTIGTADVAGELRAERSGGGTGRQYVLGYEAHDQADNVGSCRAIVSVPHDRR